MVLWGILVDGRLGEVWFIYDIVGKVWEGIGKLVSEIVWRNRRWWDEIYG